MGMQLTPVTTTYCGFKIGLITGMTNKKVICVMFTFTREIHSVSIMFSLILRENCCFGFNPFMSA